ncbi:MAG: hypothetical protein WCJ81_07215 [bacterium]
MRGLVNGLNAIMGRVPRFNPPNQNGQITILTNGTGILHQIGSAEMARDNAAARVQALQATITTQNGIVQANQRNNNNNGPVLANALTALATAQQELPAQEKIRDTNDALLRTRRPYIDYITMVQGQVR